MLKNNVTKFFVIKVKSNPKLEKNSSENITNTTNSFKMSKSTHMCVLVLMGLPGAGKSTLSKYFMEQTEENYKDANSEIVYISYDDLAQHVYQTKNYKLFRLQALEFVEHNIKLYLPIVNKKIVILIDDIMYYSSMRKQVYNLCKKYKISYCQTYVEIPYQEAITRNALRTNTDTFEKVLPESIVQMSTKFEVPSSEPWERFTCHLDGRVPYTVKTIDSMWTTIKSALLCPVEPDESFDKSTETESSRQISESHKVDIILRKFISSYIAKLKEKDPTVNISILGKELSSKKKRFMEKLNFAGVDLDNPKVAEAIKNEFKEYLMK